MRTFIVYYGDFVLIYFFILNIFYICLLLFASIKLFTTFRENQVVEKDIISTPVFPDVTILVPAFNEEDTILETFNALRKIDYDKVFYIIINDGSTDNTLKILMDYCELFPVEMESYEKIKTSSVRQVYRSSFYENLLVVDKENGGKADAMNAGLNLSSTRLICSIDADSIIDQDAISTLIASYVRRKTKIVALGGIVRVSNGCDLKEGYVYDVKLPESILAKLQVVEYIRAFLCGRAGFSQMNALPIISGAFALFDRKTTIKVGGFDSNTIGEDMELVVKMHKYMKKNKRQYNVVFVPNPICWTQVPENIKVLAGQRQRWQMGLIETMFKHKEMVFNPKYGLMGMLAMPYFFLFEMFGSVVEVVGYIIFLLSWLYGIINHTYMSMFFLLAIMFGVSISLISLLLEEFTVKKYDKFSDIAWLFFWAIAENFGYRQINSLWRILGWVKYIRQDKSWGEMQRKKRA